MQTLKKISSYLYESPGKTFLIIASFFGLLFILITPPLQTPDEIVHFMRAYQVSEGGLVSQNKDGILGGLLPKSIAASDYQMTENPSIKFHPENKYDYHKTVIALKTPLNKEDREFLNIAGGTGYSPVGYIPQAIAISVGAFFNAPPVFLMYMTRAASLVTYLVLLYLAIRIIPGKKWAIVGLGILPMILAQAGSPGVDAMSIGLGILFIALVMKYRQLTKVSTKQFLLLFVIACLIALTKQTTILVIAFALLLSPARIASTKTRAYAKLAAILIIPLVLMIGWMAVIRLSNLSIENVVEGQNNTGQVMNIIQHPLRLPEVIYHTFITDFGNGVVNGLIGVFGWVDAPLAAGFVSLGYILIAFILLTNYESVKKKFTKKQAWLVGLLGILFAVGTCAALYIIYSPVDFDVVYGLQGRYFLLGLFIIMPLLAAVPLRIAKKHYVVTICVVSFILLIASALTLYYRYYSIGF